MGEPLINPEDRSKWRLELGGPAFEAANRCVKLLKQPDLRNRLDELEALVATAAWPNWREAALRGFDAPFLNRLTGISTTVHHPAEGIAYVACPITHPDQIEALVFPKSTQMSAYFVTLIEEGARWRVHTLGRRWIPPQELGREPYSW